MYVPILKNKAGELRALEELDRTAGHPEVQPLIEVVGAEALDETELANMISKTADRLKKSWPSRRERPLMIDASMIEPEVGEEVNARQPVLGQLLDALAAREVWAIPVVHVSDSDDVVNQARERGVSVKGSRACIRVTGEDLDDSITPLDVMVKALAGQMQLRTDSVDLVLDFGALSDENALAMASRLARFMLPSLTSVRWHSVTLASGAFPVNLAEVSPFQLGKVRRFDRQLWINLNSLRLDVSLHYGDYAVMHPLLQSGVAFAAPPQLRYTRKDDWIVTKGRRTDRRGHGQFYDLCAEVLKFEANEAAPLNQSWGDDYIHKAALRTCGGVMRSGGR